MLIAAGALAGPRQIAAAVLPVAAGRVARRRAENIRKIRRVARLASSGDLGERFKIYLITFP